MKTTGQKLSALKTQANHLDRLIEEVGRPWSLSSGLYLGKLNEARDHLQSEIKELQKKCEVAPEVMEMDAGYCEE